MLLPTQDKEAESIVETYIIKWSEENWGRYYDNPHLSKVISYFFIMF